MVGARALSCSSPSGDAGSAPITARNDALRTGWYPNQAALNPAVVESAAFGRLFKTALTLGSNEIVTAQPLVFGSSVFVATESNNIYALDAVTGAITASRSLGPSLTNMDVGCPDLPTIGITGTPVLDPKTGTAYFFSKTLSTVSSDAVIYAHAVDAETLEERPNFPVEIAGTAANDPTIPFYPLYQSQRPALLLLDGVVYAAFGSHCDRGPYHGFVAAVGAQGGLVMLFATEAGPLGVRGAGFWQSGGGIVSDGPGRLLLISSNGYSNAMVAPTPGSTPPATLDESLVLLNVQPDGSLKATDFFAPYDSPLLDQANLEFGAGGPVALPDCFGTPAHPHLIVGCGKQGSVFLLDRDNLGGFLQGPAQGDGVVSMVTARDGLWTTPAVWPGDGGWVYLTPKDAPLQALRYGIRGDGAPTLAPVGTTSDPFGFFSGSPVVTSDGTTSGSALVWVAYTTGPWGSGALRAYDPIPDDTGTLRLVYQDAYGVSAKYAMPGIGAGRVYVGTADGSVLGYGAPASAALSAPSVDFGAVTVGRTATLEAVVTAAQPTTVTAVSSDAAGFTLGPLGPLPTSLAAGASMKIPVVFAPSQAEGYVGAIGISTTTGAAAVSLSGFGQSAGASLSLAPKSLSFEGIPPGGIEMLDLVLGNAGASSLQFASVQAPHAPFTATGLPAAGDVLMPGASLTVSVLYAPTASGMYADTIVVQTNGGARTVHLTGTSAPAAHLVVAPLVLDFGVDVPVGSTNTLSFSLSNTGGVVLTISNSTPPSKGEFIAASQLLQDAPIYPGQTVTASVVFKPTAAGAFQDTWVVNSSAGGGAQTVQMKGTAVALSDASSD